MDISRRGFLRKIAQVTGIGTGAYIASRLPALPAEPKELPPMTTQEQALQRLLVSHRGCVTASCYAPDCPTHYFPTGNWIKERT